MRCKFRLDSLFQFVMKSTIFTFLFFTTSFSLVFSQEPDLLSLLGEEEPVTIFTEAAFKTNHVINLHSLENTPSGVLDVKISHRFGFLSGGPYELFGLDQASMRFGFDYGVNDRLVAGLGRSSYEKTYDGYLKYKLLRQSSGEKNMPLTAAFLATAAIKTIEWPNPDQENYFSSRLYYTFQFILGRKFSESLSLQLSPTLVHRNLVNTFAEKNDVLALGVGGRVKLNRRVSLNLEYIYVLPDQLADTYRNSLSVGFDIETGGHVFQLHFTNSTSMIEKGFITETTGDPFDGNLRFGFNLSRVFTVAKRKE